MMEVQRDEHLSNLAEELAKKRAAEEAKENQYYQRDPDRSRIRPTPGIRRGFSLGEPFGEPRGVPSQPSDLEKQLDTVRAELTSVRTEIETVRAAQSQMIALLQNQLIPEGIRRTINGGGPQPLFDVPITFKTYLVHPTNEMRRLLVQAEVHPEQEKYYLTEAACLGCRILTELLNEPDYTRVVETLTGDPTQYMPAVQAIAADPEQFAEFVWREYQVLIDGGLSRALADDILKECLKIAKAVRTGEVDPQRIGEAINTLRGEGCRLADSLKKQAQEEKIRTRTKRRVKWVFMGTAAGVMAVYNVYALESLGQVFSTTSLVFAGGLAEQFFELFKDDA